MLSFKGFASVAMLIQNSPGVNSPAGELSTHAKTYTKEMGVYTHPDYFGVTIHSFSSLIVGGAPVELPETYIRRIIEVVDWVAKGTIDGQFTSDSSAFVTATLTQWAGDITDINAGVMLELAQGIFVPEYISFEALGVTGLPNNDNNNRIKIWFTDDAFVRQYDEYSIVVVPPIVPLDDLLGTFVQVNPKVELIDATERQLRIEAAKDNNPATLIRIPSYQWRNPNAPDTQIKTYWSLIIYGVAGDTPDNIKNALINYILANSNYDRDTWAEYLPDIFKTTEHVFLPMWDNVAVPNQTLLTGVFSPIVDIQTDGVAAVQRMKRFVPTYPGVHVDANTSVFPFMYRSLAALTVGGVENRDEKYKVGLRFTDYLLAPSTSGEWGRMSPETRAWVMLMSELLAVSEKAT
jgi:hypothetical protein